MQKQIYNIIDKANEKENFQEACYYIVSEIEKISPNWDIRQNIIEQIEKEYNTNIIY